MKGFTCRYGEKHWYVHATNIHDVTVMTTDSDVS